MINMLEGSNMLVDDAGAGKKAELRGRDTKPRRQNAKSCVSVGKEKFCEEI